MSAPRTIAECEPPQDARLSDFWIEVNKRCRAKPGQWFELGEYSASVASQVRDGKRPSLIPPEVAYEDRAAYMAEHYEVKTKRLKDAEKENMRLVKIRFLG